MAKLATVTETAVTETTDTAVTQRATTPNEYAFEMFSQMASLGELSPDMQVKADEIADLYNSILQTFPQGQRELYIACNKHLDNAFDAWVWVGTSERQGVVAYCANQNVNYILAKLIENGI